MPSNMIFKTWNKNYKRLKPVVAIDAAVMFNASNKMAVKNSNFSFTSYCEIVIYDVVNNSLPLKAPFTIRAYSYVQAHGYNQTEMGWDVRNYSRPTVLGALKRLFRRFIMKFGIPLFRYGLSKIASRTTLPVSSVDSHLWLSLQFRGMLDVSVRVI